MVLTAAVAEIDLRSVVANFDLVRSLAPDSRVLAVIKANAYGHGATAVARALEGADGFAVARVEEAVLLREAGVSRPITLLEGIVDHRDLAIARRHHLDVVVHSEYQLALLAEAPDLRAWIKLETGMHRLGLEPGGLDRVLDQLGRQRVLGMMGHFASADDPDAAVTKHQLACFLEATGRTGVPRSLANSAAIMSLREAHLDWVRPGLMLYGASPLADLQPQESLSVVMTLKAPVIAVKSLKKGDAVGYGGTWTAGQDTRIAVVAIGYADGYPREAPPGSPVMVGGRIRRLAGRVSMDMLTIELEAGDRVAAGDPVELWGRHVRIEHIAALNGTLPYTLMCGVSSRVIRRYHAGDERCAD